jgi:hypothetical protein
MTNKGKNVKAKKQKISLRATVGINPHLTSSTPEERQEERIH